MRKHVGVVSGLKIVPLLMELALVVARTDTEEEHVRVRYIIQNQPKAVSLITRGNLYLLQFNYKTIYKVKHFIFYSTDTLYAF